MKERLKAYFLDIWKTKNKRITAIVYIVAPILCAIVIDCFNKRSVLEGLKGIIDSPFTLFVNGMIILFTMSIGLLCKKRLAYVASVCALWTCLGVANYIIMSMRVSPFSATDLKLLGNIDNIIEVYLTPISFILIIVALVLVIVGVSVLWAKLPKYAEKNSYLKNIVIIVIMFLLTMGSIQIGIHTDKISEKFPNMTIAYYNYGFPYCFATSIFNTGVSQPDEYSKDKVMDIISQLNATSMVDSDDVKTPNIIFLQLESFIDVSKFEGLELSADATPIFNQLKEEFPSGYLTVNNVGYGTANTEFEVMTGLNLDDFGPGEFPYNTILTKTTCESTAYILKEYGYATHALHNNTATFYARNTVFKRLGFDTFTSLEYMYPEEFTVTDWAKDKVLTEEIMKVLESTEDTDYIYTISVQGHGAYPTESVLEEPAIQIINGIENEERKYMFEYYVNMINEMDEFVGQLIQCLSEFDEETVLVIYGDHLPSLEITEKELINENLYQTEYVVWNNIDLKLKDEDIESFQLSSRILEGLNIESGYINKFHQIFKGREDYFDKLHILSYDILYGNMFAYDGINPYIATDMQLGTYQVDIEEVRNATYEEMDMYNPEWKQSGNDEAGDSLEGQESSEDDNGQSIQENPAPMPEDEVSDWYIVSGDYFTNSSYVYVNGKEYETVYVDQNNLLVNVPQLATLDIFVVKQKAGATVLSSSHEFTYFYVDENDNENAQ
ncbi:MAG: LTA synthase family protein [Lachnospiraceae bacterium]|nr:LTA synthase family protein [Lachnospiraceae bacterium]